MYDSPEGCQRNARQFTPIALFTDNWGEAVHVFTDQADREKCELLKRTEAAINAGSGSAKCVALAKVNPNRCVKTREGWSMTEEYVSSLILPCSSLFSLFPPCLT